MEQDQINITPLTEREIVLETLAFYGMGGRFAFDPCGGGLCLYLDPKTGNRCAVGRCLATDKFNEDLGDVRELGVDPNEDYLPQYAGLTMSFWVDLQKVHDNAARGVYHKVVDALERLDFMEEVRDPKFRLSYPAFFYNIA